jgi:hypothetical protein
MQYQVTPSQLKGWQHPLVLTVVQAADGATDTELRRVLMTTALDSGLWKPFLRVPFTADSDPGKRLTTVWDGVKKEFSTSEMVQEFSWIFWQPERDHENAALLAHVLKREPVYRELAA